MTPEQKLADLLDKGEWGAKAKLSKFLKVSPVNVTRWSTANGGYKIPREYMAQIESYFNKPSGYLLYNNMGGTHDVPVFISSDDSGKDGVKASCTYLGQEWKEDMYAVVAKGLCMSPDVEEGDELFLDPSVEVTSGSLVHFQLNGKDGIRAVYIDLKSNILQLIPFNQSEDCQIETFRMDDDSFQDLKLNRVVAFNKLRLANDEAILKRMGR